MGAASDASRPISSPRSQREKRGWRLYFRRYRGAKVAAKGGTAAGRPALSSGSEFLGYADAHSAWEIGVFRSRGGSARGQIDVAVLVEDVVEEECQVEILRLVRRP